MTLISAIQSEHLLFPLTTNAVFRDEAQNSSNEAVSGGGTEHEAGI